MKITLPSLPVVATLCLAAIHLTQSTAKAQTWNGGGADNNWSTAGNWVGGVAPVSGTSTTILFGGSTRPNPIVDTAMNISRIEFLAGAGAFNISGTTISPFSFNTTTTAAIVNNSSVTQTVSAPISFTTSNLTYTFNAFSGDLVVNGNIAAANNRLVIGGNSGRTVTLAGSLGGTGSVASSLVINTAGVNLVLSGSNTYTGATFISRGTAYVQSNSAFGSSSVVNLGQGNSGTDAAAILIDGAYTVNRNIVLAKTSVTGTAATTLGGSTATNSSFTGTITLGNTGTFGRALTVTAVSGGQVTFSGPIVTSGTDNGDAVIKTGAGTVIFGGANTYKGTTQVNAGTLLVTGTHTGGAAYTVAAGATLGGTGSITSSATINGTANLLAGNGTAASGTLSLGGSTTFADGSVIQMTLGASGAHSTLARTGGTWTFDTDQAFTFIDLGATVGTYDNIITGLAADPGVGSWTITNVGWVGTFTYDGSNNVDLVLTAVPEPGATMLIGLGLTLFIFRHRKVRA